MRRVTYPAALLLGCLLAACGEEPPVQESPLDDGGVYEEGAIEDVQPVEAEVRDDSLAVPAAPER